MAAIMNTPQVDAELHKMVSFIHQEASEKALELRIKADEEFHLEKAALLNASRNAVITTYETRAKQFHLDQQIKKSTIANKTRLTVLTHQTEVLGALFQQAKERLGEVQKGEGYPELLRRLVLEGLFAITESRMSVRAREKDWDTVRGFLGDVEKEYREGIEGDENITLEALTLDEANPLGEDIAGGVIITGYSGRIQVDNTLEQRLALCESDALPHVRLTLLGKNPNRKWFN